MSAAAAKKSRGICCCRRLPFEADNHFGIAWLRREQIITSWLGGGSGGRGRPRRLSEIERAARRRRSDPKRVGRSHSRADKKEARLASAPTAQFPAPRAFNGRTCNNAKARLDGWMARRTGEKGNGRRPRKCAHRL
jgi:hypothetical protein